MIDIDALTAWVGRTKTQTETLHPERLSQLAATFGWTASAYEAGMDLPPLGHLLFCNELTPQDHLAYDGHAQRGSFMPPVDLPRRMWAGSDTQFIKSLKIGERVQRESKIVSVTLKQGKSGALVFVELDRRFTSPSGGELVERRTLVYCQAPSDAAPETQGLPPEAMAADLTWAFEPDEVQLFRFSALTWNGHRIHYDRQFCQEQEGYPDIVVHGPLLGLLAAQAAQSLGAGKAMKRFMFRSVQPCFVNRPLSVKAADNGQVLVTNFADETALKGHAFWE